MNSTSKQFRRWILPGSLAVLTATAGADQDRMRSWQLSLLFDPSEQQLQVEKKGRVMIYDGLESADINQVLVDQFDRVQHMMFTNTVVTDEAGNPERDPETGLPVVEDDGC